MNRQLIDDYLGELLGTTTPPSTEAASSAPVAPVTPSASPPAAPVPPVLAAEPSSGDSIDEDEFEALLDALHGGGAPGQATSIPPTASPPEPTASASAALRTTPETAVSPSGRSGAVGGRDEDTPAPPPGSRSLRWLRLRVHQQDYGVELLRVQEVLLPVGVLPLRDAEAALLGVMSLRGVVVPVLDLGLWLGLEEVSDTPQTRFVVLEHNGTSLALKVSAVLDVHAVADPEIEPAEHTLVEPSVALLRGVTRLNGRPVILLDALGLLG